MKEYEKCHEALTCTHCGKTSRMLVVASGKDTTDDSDRDGPPFESGILYQVQRCLHCRELLLVAGNWHEAMEGPEDWYPQVLLPQSGARAARRLLELDELDRTCMQLAVSEARRCTPERGLVTPKVGAAVAYGGRLVASYRGEIKAGGHAEYTLLEEKCAGEALAGATVYTTLEPCTVRSADKVPCAYRLIGRKVARVVIGMLDPDTRIRGAGVLALRKANIRVDLFPPDLMMQLEELNRDFIVAKERGQVEQLDS